MINFVGGTQISNNLHLLTVNNDYTTQQANHMPYTEVMYDKID